MVSLLLGFSNSVARPSVFIADYAHASLYRVFNPFMRGGNKRSYVLKQKGLKGLYGPLFRS